MGGRRRQWRGAASRVAGRERSRRLASLARARLKTPPAFFQKKVRSSIAPVARFPPVRASCPAIELLPFLDFFPMSDFSDNDSRLSNAYATAANETEKFSRTEGNRCETHTAHRSAARLNTATWKKSATLHNSRRKIGTEDFEPQRTQKTQRGKKARPSDLFAFFAVQSKAARTFQFARSSRCRASS